MGIYEELPLYPAAMAAPVRLLTLKAARRFDAKLECELSISSLHGDTSFEALSYTWGSMAKLESIAIRVLAQHGANSLDGEFEHEVTANLAAALRHLRRPDEDRVLWVDALCINQADNDEKSHQVAQMRHVYTGPCTRRVVVWLGEQGTARVALEFLRRLEEKHSVMTSKRLEDYFPELTSLEDKRRALIDLSNRVEVARLDGKSFEYFMEHLATSAEKDYMTSCVEWTSSFEAYRSVNHLLEGHQPEWTACRDLFGRDWWSRTWILQEVIHSGRADMYIGDLEPIPVDTLCHLATRYYWWLSYGPTLHQKPRNIMAKKVPDRVAKDDFHLWLQTSSSAETAASTILTLRKKYADLGDAAAPRLPELLLRLRKQAATDPRDKIYGLVGMSTNEYGIDTDYNISKRRLYTRMARYMMRKSLAVLFWIESPGREISASELPSWVVDYCTQQSSPSLALMERWPLFTANQGFPPPLPPGAREPHLVQPIDEETLVLRGIHVATITEIRDVRVPGSATLEGEHTVRLFSYQMPNGQHHRIDKTDGNAAEPFRHSSWGPCHAGVGDIVIVAAMSTMPLVLRPDPQTGDFLFVGGCWLVESEIHNIIEVEENTGFPAIMWGSACSGEKTPDVQCFRIR